MWENPIFKKVWEVGKKSAVLMKKHYKNGLMLGVLLLAMFFLGRSIGAIAYGLRMQREMSPRETVGSALENTQEVLSAENWGLGFGAEGTQPTGTASAEKLKEYNAYYVGAAEEKKIYLTFDCGYENGNSSAILDALKKHNAPATFFVVGHFLETAPEMVKRMVEDGHTVGNHTYHHVQLNKLNETKAREEILKTNNLIYETTGVYPLYLRPPFGAWKKNLELCVEMLPVFWTIDTLDWKVQNTEKIVRTVQEQIEDGAIILMHDEYDTSVEAALQVVDELKNQGYELVTVDQLILP